MTQVNTMSASGTAAGVASQPPAEIPFRAHDFDAAEFRATMGAFPAAVSVVTALDEQGAPRGLTCSAVCSLSMDPPSMLICVNRRNKSLQAIERSDGFVVNLLRAGKHELSDLFASPSPDKFDGTDWCPSPASGLPLLANDALAFVDCALASEILAGSHAVLVGQVRESGFVDPSDGPLVYYRRNYGQWSPHVRFAEMPDIYA
jgi:flavin reductase (NADH)